MLTESLLASLYSQHAKPSTTYPKDATLFTLRLAPSPSLLSTHKKCPCTSSALASSSTHVFTANPTSATVQVLSRASGSLQTVVPFRSRITALTLVDGGLTAVLGTENGGLLIWETATGRVVQTDEAHLGSVTGLGATAGGRVVVSSSEDGNLHVWDLGTVMAWNAKSRAPVRTLRGHKGGVSAVKVGKGVVVSVAVDGLMLWDWQEGYRLRKILLPDGARCLELDPCERAVFVGYEDGSVVLVDFFDMDGVINVRNPVWDDENRNVIVQVGEGQRWRASGEELGGTTCMAVSYDSTKLVTGHESGRVAVWDVPTGTFHSQLTTTPLPGPISNLVMLPVQGLLKQEKPRLSIKEVVKPRFGELESMDGQMPSNYKFTAHLVGRLPHQDLAHVEDGKASVQSDFERSHFHSSFPTDILESSLAELESWRGEKSRSNGTEHQADYMALDEDTQSTVLAQLEQENAELKKKFEVLQRLQKASFNLQEKQQMEISRLQTALNTR